MNHGNEEGRVKFRIFLRGPKDGKILFRSSASCYQFVSEVRGVHYDRECGEFYNAMF